MDRSIPVDAEGGRSSIMRLVRSNDENTEPFAEAQMEHEPVLLRSAEEEAKLNAALCALAIELRQMREARNQFFGRDTFDDPAWDILLALYIARSEGRLITVSQLCFCASVRPTDALRTVSTLCDETLIERELANDNDEVVYMCLSSKGLAMTHNWLLRCRDIRDAAKIDDKVDA